jgi:hypothetical protein
MNIFTELNTEEKLVEVCNISLEKYTFTRYR